ncbi:MAG: pyrimidine 5'-nucleotidase [Neomegalonema sp.]|nr:pyrimidine 5'-nucleotidase [Neomegalonema sp.]
MPKDDLAHVREWIFDLDNTLYHPDCRLFDQIDKRINGFIRERLGLDNTAADTLRRTYWHEHGTTLAGLMAEHAMAPEEYLDHVHDIDLSHVPANPGLRAAIAALPGRKIVYTNGSRAHGERVAAQLGIADQFEQIFGIEDSGFTPKPQRAAYDRVMTTAAISPQTAAMFEDTARNLAVPHALGMRCVWVRTDCEKASEGAHEPYVHHVADDLAEFLTRLT